MVFDDNKTQVNIINTNARSLRPKIASFIQCFINLSLTLAVVSETWLAAGSGLERQAEDLLLGEGLRMYTLNRQPLDNGVAYGGVAIVLRDSITKACTYNFPNPEMYEVLPLSVTIVGVPRKMFVVAAYIPPGYTVPRGKACLQHIADLVLTIKNRHAEPLILIAGDFNQWDIGAALAEFGDIEELVTPPTRADRKIDKIFTNWSDCVEEGGCIPPLRTEEIQGSFSESDHNIQYCIARIPRKEPVKWESYSYRPYSTQGEAAFVEEMAAVNWDQLLQSQDVNKKVGMLHAVLGDMMNRHFPLKTAKRRETDLPWLDQHARKMIKKKSAIYKAEGQSARWLAMREKIDKHLEKRREAFLAKQRDKFIGPQAHVSFFANVKNFKSPEKPKEFDIRTLCPGKADKEVATEVAEFFNTISSEFEPLQTGQIPFTYHRELPSLSESEVEKMIKDARKPKSMVEGDIFPNLVNLCAAKLRTPVTDIFNTIIREHVWPLEWKREYVTVIPKKNIPESLADLRNISCTPLLSKIFEAYMLARIKEETSIKANQYGGVKGCSTTHMVVGLLQEICENAEDYRSATILTAIDYSKAFNRVSFQHCLESFRRKGASTPTLKILASFLSNRTMTVKVGSEWSEPLQVNGGCPQGSVLGVALFNNTTDNLEDDFMAGERDRLRLPPVPRPPSPPPNDPERAVATSTSTPRQEDRDTVPDIGLSPISAGGYYWNDEEAHHRPALPYMQNSQPILIEPPEERPVGTQVLLQKQTRIFKYVDDNLICERLNFGSTPVVNLDGVPMKRKQAINSQNAFRSISSNAEAIGMKVNASKTNVLCISDALSYTPATYIVGPDGEVIEGKSCLKVLGFHFSSKPTVQLHVDNIVRKMRQRSWFLRNLGRVGFSSGELVKVYMSVILPIADYCAPAYHSMLTDINDQRLEYCQVEALRCIYGYGQSARTLRWTAGLQTLRDRRIEATDKFARKAAADPKFCHWFPRRTAGRTTRNKEVYEEKHAKCDRLMNSPIYYMRRRLNGKQGKVYGERNRQYRENFQLQD